MEAADRPRNAVCTPCAPALCAPVRIARLRNVLGRPSGVLGALDLTTKPGSPWELPTLPQHWAQGQARVSFPVTARGCYAARDSSSFCEKTASLRPGVCQGAFGREPTAPLISLLPHPFRPPKRSPEPASKRSRGYWCRTRLGSSTSVPL